MYRRDAASRGLPWKMGASYLLVALAMLGRAGALYVFRACHSLDVYLRGAASRSHRCSKPTHWNLTVRVAPRGAGGFLPVQAQHRLSLMDAVGQCEGTG